LPARTFTRLGDQNFGVGTARNLTLNLALLGLDGVGYNDIDYFMPSGLYLPERSLGLNIFVNRILVARGVKAIGVKRVVYAIIEKNISFPQSRIPDCD